MNTAIEFIFLFLSLCVFADCDEKRVVPHPCPINEHFTTCVNDCPTPVCSDLSPPSCLSLVCNAGCECNEGFVRINKPYGVCIPVEKCKNCQRSDFFFNECGSPCNNTCEQVLSGHDVCLTICEPGCFCRRGVFDEYSSRCIPPKLCRKRC